MDTLTRAARRENEPALDGHSRRRPRRRFVRGDVATPPVAAPSVHGSELVAPFAAETRMDGYARYEGWRRPVRERTIERRADCERRYGRREE